LITHARHARADATPSGTVRYQFPARSRSPLTVEDRVNRPQIVEALPVAAGSLRSAPDRPAVGEQLEEPDTLRRRDRAATSPHRRPAHMFVTTLHDPPF
jgi:hypothetical protein